MQKRFRIFAVVAGFALAGTAAAQITLYQGEGFHGRAFTATGDVWNLDRTGFNDRASSIIVERGRWEVCEHARFEGRCVVLRRGNYHDLRDIGLENQISSLRPVGGRRSAAYEAAPPPAPAPVYEYRQRPGERLYEVRVDSVRAVVGPPQQRCWVERQQVYEGHQPNVPGAIAGAIIGGIIGHQIGGGRGRDVATAAGAVGGAAIGAGVPGGPAYGRDVQRCASAPPGPPEYWDVSYNFRGVWHNVQMSAPPGPTIWVNERGEPRG
jgi:uncharacterized protein YcfJ